MIFDQAFQRAAGRCEAAGGLSISTPLGRFPGTGRSFPQGTAHEKRRLRKGTGFAR